jgi:hypothetical protein
MAKQFRWARLLRAMMTNHRPIYSHCLGEVTRLDIAGRKVDALMSSNALWLIYAGWADRRRWREAHAYGRARRFVFARRRTLKDCSLIHGAL